MYQLMFFGSLVSICCYSLSLYFTRKSLIELRYHSHKKFDRCTFLSDTFLSASMLCLLFLGGMFLYLISQDPAIAILKTTK